MGNPFIFQSVEWKVWERLKTMRVGAAFSDKALQDVIEETLIVYHDELSDAKEEITEDVTEKVTEQVSEDYDVKLRRADELLIEATDRMNEATDRITEVSKIITAALENDHYELATATVEPPTSGTPA